LLPINPVHTCNHRPIFAQVGWVFQCLLRAFKHMEEEYRTVCSTASNLSRSMLANTLPKLRGATPTRLGDISRVVRGSTPRPAGDPRFFNGREVPWITVSEITRTSSVYLSSTTTSLTAEGAKHSRHLKSGTVVLSNSGWTLGVPKVLAIDGCANDGVAAFLELSPAILPEFLYYSLKRLTDYFRIVVAAGGDQPNLNTARIASVEIPLPPIQEQQHFLSEIEALNNVQEVTNERIAIAREMALRCEVSA
jgi:type I restriction enzyme S subunit